MALFKINKGEIMNFVNSTQLKTDIPSFDSGDTIIVHNRIVEGRKHGFKNLKVLYYVVVVLVQVKQLLFVKNQMELVLNNHLTFTLHLLKKLKLSSMVK